jgi:hypothetical protein
MAGFTYFTLTGVKAASGVAGPSTQILTGSASVPVDFFLIMASCQNE